MKINWTRLESRLIPLLVLLGFLLNFVMLSASAIWLDEAFSIKLASQSFSEIIATLRIDNGSPLFYFMLHGWMSLFGTGEYICTLLTVLTACVSLVAVVFLLREAFTDPSIRIMGTALMALCTVCLHHATNLRYYPMMILLSTLSYLFFYRAVRLGRWREWGFFALVSAAGLYEHTLYVFVPFAQFMLLSLFYRQRFKAGFMAFIAIGLAYLPWLPILLSQVLGYSGGTTPDPIPRLSICGGPLPSYLYSISNRMWTIDSFWIVRMWIAVLAIGFIVYQLWKTKCATENDRHARDFLLAHLFSVGLMVVVSLVRPVFWLNKFDLIGLPLVFGMTGYVLTRLPLANFAMGALLAINLAGTLRYTYWRITGNLDSQRAVIEKLAPELQEDDALIETGLSLFTVDYYLGQMNISKGTRYVFPAVQSERPACIDLDRLVQEHDAVTAEATALVQKIKTGKGRIYVFHSPHAGFEPLYVQLNAAFALEKIIPVRQHPWGPVYTQVDVYHR